jgi:hypothetical protein
LRNLILIAAAIASPAAGAEGAVWGDDRFALVAPPLAVTVTDDGGVCAIDEAGVTCFDATGGVRWELDLTGYDVYDAVAGTAEIALYTALGTVIVPFAGGQALVLDPTTFVAARADGALVLIGGPDGAPIPEGYPLTEVIAHPDGRVGLFDDRCDLLWITADGVPIEAVELALPCREGLRAIPLSDGFAVIDDLGLSILDAEGNLRATLELRVVDAAAPLGGPLFVSDGEGVISVDPLTGAMLRLEAEVPARHVAASRDRLVASTADGGRLFVWEGDRLIGGVGHRDPLVALVPDGGGGLASVDASGLAIRWTSGGEGDEIAYDAIDVALDLQGGAWIARLDGLSRRAGSEERRFDLLANALTGLPDGVVAQTADALVRLDAKGAPRWEVPGAVGRIAHGEGALTVTSGQGLAVVDASSGARRRMIQVRGAELTAAGVAVGGLIALGEQASGPVGGRPPQLSPLAGLPASYVAPALAPSGRFAAHNVGATGVVVADLTVRPLATLRAGAPVARLALDGRYVWIGRSDGRIERWDVAAEVVAAPLPAFDGYAQLEDFAPPPAPTEPAADATYGGIRGLAPAADGSLALLIGGLAIRGPEGGIRVIALPEGGAPSVARSTPDRGLVVGMEDGRVIARADSDAPSVLARLGAPVTDLCAAGDRLIVATTSGVRAIAPSGDVGPAAGAPTGGVGRLACDPRGRWAAAIVAGEVHTWDVASGAPLARLRQGAPITALAPTRAGLLTGGEDEVVALWEPNRWTIGAMLEGHGAPIDEIASSADGRYAVVGAGGVAFAWDVDAGRVLQTVDLGQPVSGIAATSAARVAVSGRGGRLVEIALGAPRAPPAPRANPEVGAPLVVPVGPPPAPVSP